MVLFVCDQIRPGGGPPGYTHNLREGFDQIEDHPELETKFWGLSQSERNRSTGSNNAEPNLLVRMVQWAVKRIGGLQRGLREAIDGADTVVLQGYQSPARLRYAIRAGKVLIYMPHSPTIMADEYWMHRSLEGRPTSRIVRAFIRQSERSLISRAHYVAFPTRGAADAYFDAFPQLKRARIVYLESGVDAPTLSPSCDRTATVKPTVLFVGRYVPHKGYDLFVSAAKALASNTGATFATLGGGHGKIDSPHVTDLGWSDSPASIIADAGIVVVPNRSAYFDLLPLEAAALAKPLVMTSVGGNVDQAAALPDTILCSVDELSDAIEVGLRKLTDDPTWGAANRSAYLSRFTSKHMAYRWQSALSSLT